MKLKQFDSKKMRKQYTILIVMGFDKMHLFSGPRFSLANMLYESIRNGAAHVLEEYTFSIHNELC